MIVKTAIDFCHITYDGNKISNASSAAYWLACQHYGDCSSALKVQEDAIIEGFLSMANALGYRVEKIAEAPSEEPEWLPISDAPRDGTEIEGKTVHSDEPMLLFWSTNYSIFGQGGCWTNSHGVTLGDGFDVTHFRLASPAEPASLERSHGLTPVAAE